MEAVAGPDLIDGGGNSEQQVELPLKAAGQETLLGSRASSIMITTVQPCKSEVCHDTLKVETEVVRGNNDHRVQCLNISTKEVADMHQMADSNETASHDAASSKFRQDPSDNVVKAEQDTYIKVKHPSSIKKKGRIQAVYQEKRLFQQIPSLKRKRAIEKKE